MSSIRNVARDSKHLRTERGDETREWHTGVRWKLRYGIHLLDVVAHQLCRSLVLPANGLDRLSMAYSNAEHETPRKCVSKRRSSPLHHPRMTRPHVGDPRAND